MLTAQEKEILHTYHEPFTKEGNQLAVLVEQRLRFQKIDRIVSALLGLLVFIVGISAVTNLISGMLVILLLVVLVAAFYVYVSLKKKQPCSNYFVRPVKDFQARGFQVTLLQPASKTNEAFQVARVYARNDLRKSTVMVFVPTMNESLIRDDIESKIDFLQKTS